MVGRFDADPHIDIDLWYASSTLPDRVHIECRLSAGLRQTDQIQPRIRYLDEKSLCPPCTFRLRSNVIISRVQRRRRL